MLFMLLSSKYSRFTWYMIFTNKEILGIIPARGGSTSVPRKNIRPFLGKPLIAWAIEALQKSGVVTRVIVSTEDAEIADVARLHGAEVPFLRPAELATHLTPTLPVLQHAVEHLAQKENYNPDYVVLLEPTSPGKQPRHIRDVVNLLMSTSADAVVSVSEVPAVHNPHWQFNLGEDGRLELFPGGTIKQVIRRRQDLPKTYSRGSSIYAFKPHHLFSADPNFYGEDTRGYVIDPKYSFDIDMPEDWEIAERAMKRILEEEIS